MKQYAAMEYADVNGQRSAPQPNLKGTCPLCGHDAVSKCGPKVIWHWAHMQKRHCDPWWENETPWHWMWKSFFPEDQREVVHFDARSGEKHIADVKTARGLVIELQNSAMTLNELQSREAFYKRMIWIVNAEPFKSQLHMLDPLPDPQSELARGLVFCHARHNQKGRLFRRKSETPVGATMAPIHSMMELQEQIALHYNGHHLFDWIRPRTVWYDATAPVFLDMGHNELLWLKPYDDRGLRCVQRVSKQALITRNGGTYVSQLSQD